MQQICSEDLQKVNQRLTRIEIEISQINTAFRRNDLGTPDYDGHRNDHIEEHSDSETMKQYKYKFTEKLLSILAGGLGLALLTGTVSILSAKLGLSG